MKLRITFILSLALICSTGHAQQKQKIYSIIKELKGFSAIKDSVKRQSKIDQWWAKLQKSKSIPITTDDSVAFLYKGTAASVDWVGDFNAWSGDKNFPNKGKRIHGTDVWVLTASFPSDARLDYKIVVDQKNWIVDPANKNEQWSGMGGGNANSELRMPKWKPEPLQNERPGITKGTLTDNLQFESKVLGYTIMYRVYLPADYKSKGKLSVLYVTDGYEYLHPKMGNMTTVLDNLNKDKKIEPLIVVFIDQREPSNTSNNRRMTELALSDKYLEFFTSEFMPIVESQYPVQQDANHRGILGTSLGGLTSAYFAFSRPDLFGRAGIQSPAFWYRPAIYTICDKAVPGMKISMTSGLIHDQNERARQMAETFKKNGCRYTLRETQEAHSWGNWKNLLDDILVDLFGI